MSTFLKTYHLALTPLSPVHIGCGEDFEPTNYVIDDGVLYGFDPGQALLNDAQRSQLSAIANRASLLGIQRFFKDNTQVFKVHADTLIPVSSGIAMAYEQGVGRAANIEVSGNQVFNKFFIERTMYTGRERQPYIPGSSFKGAIRTAILDHHNQEQRITRPEEIDRRNHAKSDVVESRLLKGDFATSPLRLLKVADLMPATHCQIARRVVFGVNHKKKQVVRDGKELQPKGIAVRKECILHGQYRAFVADAVLPSLNGHNDRKTTPAPELRPNDLRAIAKQSNAYNLVRLRRELSILDGRGLVNPAWKQSIEVLIAGPLGANLSSGNAFLIRLGRFGGAESKTLSGEGVASIKIMGARGQPPTFESTTKTVWLAAEQENERKHMLPFGWAVVEIDPQDDDSPELRAWCFEQAKGRREMGEIRQQFELEKRVALKQKAEIAAQAAQREAARQAAQVAEALRQQALANMSIQCQQIESLRQACEDWANRIANGNFKKQGADAGKAGFFQEADRLVKQALSGNAWTAQDKITLAYMLEAWLPKVVAPWDKDQRKKLKLTALKGL